MKSRYTSPDRLVIQGEAPAVCSSPCEHASGSFQGGGVAGAVCRRHQHDARCIPAADDERVSGVGNPNEKPAFDYMMRCSPRQRQAGELSGHAGAGVAQRQPGAVLRGTKLVAKLRATKTDTNPLLLKANMGAGHGGSSGRYDALRETAFTYAFMLWQMGVPVAGTATSSGGSAGR